MKILRRPKELIWALVIILVGLGLDRWSKYVVLHEVPYRVVVTPFFSLDHRWNKGISWGLFSSSDSHVILLGVSFVLVLILLGWLLRASSWGRIGLSLMIAGALGNVWDRIADGAVFDFLHVHWGRWSFPVFNIADTLISVGVLVMLGESLLCQKQVQSERIPSGGEDG